MNEDKMEFEKSVERQTKNTIEYYKNLDNIEEVPIDILRAMYKDLLQTLESYKQTIEKKDIKIIKLGEKLVNSIPKKKIEDKKNKIHEEYINILSEYGNIDTDITFDIPNKNVRKHLDELMLEIMILQELLEGK